MKKTVSFWQGIGFIFTLFAGTLSHFLYEWLGNPLWISPFSSVNESTWEHIKLIFWPMLIFAIFQSFFFKNRENFWCVKLRGILLGIILIPVVFYTYNGAIGKTPDWLNILIFFISAGGAYFYEKNLFYKNDLQCKSPEAALAALVFIALLFAVFTFKTPNLNIFKDPLTGTYGI